MPNFVRRQPPHRAFVRRSNPTRREPGLLDSVLDPIASGVVDPVASKVVKPIANNVVNPVVTPIVQPLVAPLTQGGGSGPAQTTPPPPPANTPPRTTSPSGGSSGGDGSGGAGNDGNGGNGDNNGNGNGNSGGGNNGGNGNGNGNSGGGGHGNSGGGGHGSSGGGGHGSSGGGGHGSSGGSGHGSSGGSGSGNGNGTGGGIGSGGVNNSGDGGVSGVGTPGVTGIGSGQTPTGAAGASGSSPSPGSSFFTTGGGVPVNAGSDPNSPAPDSNINDSLTGSTAINPGPSGIGTPGTAGNGNGGSGLGGGSVHGNGATTGQKGDLSTGAIVGIVVSVLFVVGIAIILIVRRRRKRSNARQQQWWFSRNVGSATYNDGIRSDTFIEARSSVRSSFETTVDHSQTPRLELNLEVPSLPPMAQLRREPVLINLDTPATGPQVTVTRHDSLDSPSRFSVGTATSSVASSDVGQWLIVNPRGWSEGGQTSPMSVRPFSPTEAFSFPKPPMESNGSNYGPPTSMPHSAKGTIQDLPGLPVPSPSSNPFDDPDPSVAPASAVKLHKIPSPINVAAANPFVDPLPNLPPEPNTPSAVHPEFMEVEVIKRPFVPTLSDEILVEVGDNVKILQMFDDGWSLVEKNPIFSVGLKGKGKTPEVGLIPIDCFRNVGQGVNEFIASKRVSSYSQMSGPVAGGGVLVV